MNKQDSNDIEKFDDFFKKKLSGLEGTPPEGAFDKIHAMTGGDKQPEEEEPAGKSRTLWVALSVAASIALAILIYINVGGDPESPEIAEGEEGPTQTTNDGSESEEVIAEESVDGTNEESLEGPLYYIIGANNNELASKESITEKELDGYAKESIKAYVVDEEGVEYLLAYNDEVSGVEQILQPVESIDVRTRSVSLSSTYDFENQFSKAPFSLLNKAEFTVSEELYKISDEQFFYVSYVIGKDTINKKLEASGQKLVLDRSELLKVDGRALNNKEVKSARAFKLYFYNSSSKEGQEVCSLDIQFPSTKSLKGELFRLIKRAKTKDRFTVVNRYLSYMYSPVFENDLRSFVELPNE